MKFLAKKAETVLISFEEARSRITSAKNIVFTGTPVKIEKKEYEIGNLNKKIKEKYNRLKVLTILLTMFLTLSLALIILK